MPTRMKRRKKRTKGSVSLSRFKKLVLPRPDVLHCYLRHNDINLYLEYLQHRYAFVEVHTIGATYEHRQLKAIEINWYSEKNMIAQEHPLVRPPTNVARSTTFRNFQRSCNPAGRNVVFIEGGTHAREWITISVALNCIYQLTEKYLRNFELLRKLRFVIVPISNPDGYEYTWTKNRRWRKNRRPHGKHKYIGTDCNRNYDVHWEDGSSKANRNTYKGSRPFSEPETRALRNELLKYAPNLLFFLSLHSYAQSIMYPWAYSKELPETWAKLEKLALCGRNAIKAYNGRHYRIGSIAKLTKRRISGSIVDYAFGVIKVPLALVMELPSSAIGFQPPAELISPIGHESWFGIREMCKTAYDLVPSIDPAQLQAIHFNNLSSKLTNGSVDGPTTTTATMITTTATTTSAAPASASSAKSTTSITAVTSSISISPTASTSTLTSKSIIQLGTITMVENATAKFVATVTPPTATLAANAENVVSEGAPKMSMQRAMALTAAEISNKVHNQQHIKRNRFPALISTRDKPVMNASSVPVKC